MQPGQPAARTHDYIRHGTSTLVAALEIATGHVTAAGKPRHRRQESLTFLKQVARAYPERELQLVMDNYAVHQTPEVKAWLAENLRFQVHFTPTSASRLNLVEVRSASSSTGPTSLPCPSSTSGSGPSSPAGTTDTTALCGPGPAPKSSRKPTAQRL